MSDSRNWNTAALALAETSHVTKLEQLGQLEQRRMVSASSGTFVRVPLGEEMKSRESNDITSILLLVLLLF